MITEKIKNKIGIGALAIVILCLFFYSGIVIAEYVVSKYGQDVDAKVIDVSDLCKYKRKYITILISNEYKRIRVYGLPCRKDEFIINSIIKVKQNNKLGIITIPNNYNITRLIFFPLFTIIISIGFIILIREKEKNPT